jgi:cyclic di-GMP phosphodiesterase Gmr
VSRASDPLAATASRDARVQVLASRLAAHFSQLTAEALAEAVPGALELLAEHTDVDIAFATLIDHDRIVEVWEWAAEGVASAPPEAGWSVDHAFGAGAQVLRRGIAIPIPDVGLLTFDAETTARFERAEVGALALVPVRRQDELVGVVGFLTSGRLREWSPETITQLDVFGDMLLSAVLRVRFQAGLAVADARMRRIAELVPDALLFVAEDGRITWASRSAVTVLARTPENLLGRRPGELVHPAERDMLRDAVRMARDGAALPPLRCQVEVGDGYRWCEISLSYADDGTTTPETLLSVRDTHESQLEAERLATSASTDHLTGALNRTGLRELLAALAERGTPLALAFCDLDGFKQVNDRYGHPTGDAVLVEVAARLRQASRPTDALARLGGDEFVVVLTGIEDVGRAGQLAERLVRAIAGPDGAMSLTAGGGVLNVPVSLSVGVALSARGLTTDALLQRADTAMYEAKRQGKNRWASVPA